MRPHERIERFQEGEEDTSRCSSSISYPHRARRRHHISVAIATTAAALAASACCSVSNAFSHNTHACHSAYSSSILLQYSPNDSGDLIPPRGGRTTAAATSSSFSRQQHGSLQMVSFLESEMMTREKASREKVKSRSRARAQRSGSSSGQPSGRTLDLHFDAPPGRGQLDFDSFVSEVTGNVREGSSGDSSRPSQSRRQRRVGSTSLASARASLNSSSETVESSVTPEIDSIVLYSSISKAPAKQATATATTKIEQQLDNHGSKHTTKSVMKGTNTKVNTQAPKKTPQQRQQQTFKSKSKSSTMPGFIKTEGLDEYITARTTTRMRRTSTKHRISRLSKQKRRQLNSEALYKKSSSVPDSLLDYAQEIHAISRVSPKEEIELGTKTQEAMRLQTMYADLERKYGREPTDDEWCAAAGKINMEALKEALQAGNEAKNQLVASNLRMVQRVVNLYIRNGLGSEYNAGDLMQDGTIALIRAAEKYEPERGFRFSTYAMYWIRSAVKRSQTMQSRIVNVPQRIHETYKRVSKVEAELKVELGRDPTKSELADSCEITVMQLDRCRRAMQQAAFSLDAEIYNSKKPGSNGSHSKRTMFDIVSSKIDETEYERSQRLIMREHLINTLRRYLTPHEVDLLLLRYGLVDPRALPKGMSGPLTIAGK